MLRAAFIFNDVESKSARRRVLDHMDLFEREAVDVYPMTAPKGIRRRRKMLKDLSAFDVTVLVKVLMTPVELAFLRRGVRVLGFDLDDALFLSPRGLFETPAFLRRMELRGITGAADFVTAGNLQLAGLAGAAAGKTLVIPTPVDAGRCVPAAERAPGPIRIGWTGSKATMTRLDAVLPAVERVARLRPGVTLTVVADAAPPERDFLRHARPAANPPAGNPPAGQVAEFDIALAPLEESDGAGGGCFEILIYGACGVPTIASPTAAAREMIAGGETGLFASSGGQWQDALLALVDNAGERRRLGAAARAKVLAEYSAEAVMPGWASALKRFAARR